MLRYRCCFSISVPKNHQLLAVRCQVLNSQSRYSEALKDADAVIEQKPTWSKVSSSVYF